MIEDVLATSATILQLAQTIQTKSRDVTLVSNDLVKTLKVASKLPFGIGFVAGLVKKAYVRVHYNVEELDSVFDQTKTRLDVLAPTITYLAVGAGLAREIAREADQSVGHSQQGLFFLSRAIGLGVQDVVGFSQDLAVWQSQVSQDTAAINSFLSQTETYFETLEAVNASFSGTVDLLHFVNASLDDILAITNFLAGPLNELTKALEPVSWALDKAQDIIDAVVGPIVKAVLEATGLQDLLDQAEKLLEPITDAIAEMRDRLLDINIALDADIIGDADIAWDAIRGAYGIDLDVNGDWVKTGTGLIPDIINYPPIVSVAPNGDKVMVGTIRDDTLIGGAGNDILIGGLGDDSLIADGGTDDIAVFLGEFTTFEIRNLGAGIYQATYREAEDAEQGTDLLSGFEFLMFEDSDLGLIDIALVDLFQFADNATPNLTGGPGEDWLIGHSGANNLAGAAGDDRLFGAGGNDVLTGGTGDDRMFGGDGDDRMFGGDGDDRMFGGDGDDLFVIGDVTHLAGERDLIRGGAGSNDLEALGGLVFDMRTGQFTAVLGDYGVIATGIEAVTGTSFADTILTSLGDDNIFTGGGDDLILGVTGSDTINGGAGIDTISFAGNGSRGMFIEVHDPITGLPNRFEDLATFDGRNFTGTAEVAGVEVFEGTGFADIFHAAYRIDSGISVAPFTVPWATNTVTGSAFRGLDGADQFVSGRGNDAFDGGAGVDIVSYLDPERFDLEGDRPAFLVLDLALGTATANLAGTDELISIEGAIGTLSPEILRGNAKGNAFYGLEGRDTLEGRGDADYLDGGAADDARLGGAGDDYLIGHLGEDTLDGGAGIDTVELDFRLGFQLDIAINLYVSGQTYAALQPDWVVAQGAVVDLALGTATTYEIERTRFGDPNEISFEQNETWSPSRTCSAPGSATRSWATETPTCSTAAAAATPWMGAAATTCWSAARAPTRCSAAPATTS